MRLPFRTSPAVHRLCAGKPQNNMRTCAIRSRAIATFINVSFELSMTICHVNGVKPGSSLGQIDCHSQPSDPAMYQRPSTAPSPVSHNTALCLFLSCFFPNHMRISPIFGRRRYTPMVLYCGEPFAVLPMAPGIHLSLSPHTHSSFGTGDLFVHQFIRFVIIHSWHRCRLGLCARHLIARLGLIPCCLPIRSSCLTCHAREDGVTQPPCSSPKSLTPPFLAATRL